MNGKRAKQLRNMLKDRYTEDTYYEEDKRGALKMQPNCRRYNYQVLKRMFKRGELEEVVLQAPIQYNIQ